MPAPKPTTLPRWADVGAAITEPAEAKKNVGWVPGDRPPAQVLNWLLHLLYTWVQYVNDLASQAWTWTAAHTFNAAVSLPGGISGPVTFAGLTTHNGGLTAAGTTTLAAVSAAAITTSAGASIGGDVTLPAASSLKYSGTRVRSRLVLASEFSYVDGSGAAPHFISLAGGTDGPQWHVPASQPYSIVAAVHLPPLAVAFLEILIKASGGLNTVNVQLLLLTTGHWGANIGSGAPTFLNAGGGIGTAVSIPTPAEQWASVSLGAGAGVAGPNNLSSGNNGALALVLNFPSTTDDIWFAGARFNYVYAAEEPSP